jgi:hypothetical protein
MSGDITRLTSASNIKSNLTSPRFCFRLIRVRDPFILFPHLLRNAHPPSPPRPHPMLDSIIRPVVTWSSPRYLACPPPPLHQMLYRKKSARGKVHDGKQRRGWERDEVRQHRRKAGEGPQGEVGWKGVEKRAQTGAEWSGKQWSNLRGGRKSRERSAIQ